MLPADEHPEPSPVGADAALQEALRGALAAIEGRLADGALRSPVQAGPMATAYALLTELTIAPLCEPGSLAGILRGLLRHQREDGSFPFYQGGPGSRDTTRVVYGSLCLALREPWIRDDPALLGATTTSCARCAAFLASDAPAADLFFHRVLANAVLEAVAPAIFDDLPVLHTLGDVALRLLAATPLFELAVSDYVADLLPALSLLVETSGEAPASWLPRLFFQAFGDLRGASRDQRISTIRELQDGEGSWGWQVISTCINLLALHRAGVPAIDPAVARGLAFLRTRRLPRDGGTLAQLGFEGSTWDTATFAVIAVEVRQTPRAQLEEMADRLLAACLPDGLWSFSLGGVAEDNDTSSVALTALCALVPVVGGSRRAALVEAIHRGAAALARVQRDGGGYGAFHAVNPFEFRASPPLSLLSVADASSADVTGRVLGALRAARATGLLAAGTDRAVQEAMEAATWFLERAYHLDRHGWWSRWMAGYLPGYAFVLPTLVQVGVVAAERRAEVRTALLEAQHGDGSWGESVQADLCARHALHGAATPAHTAFGVVGLLFCMAEEDSAASAAVERGVAWLLAHRQPEGWRNGRPVYTFLVGIDYYDHDDFTTIMAMHALVLYSRWKQVGLRAARLGYRFNG